MQKLGRLMVSLGVAATLGMMAAAVFGLRGVDDEAELRVHVLIGLAPLLLFVLSHLWILFYLLGATRLLQREAVAIGAAADPALSSFRRQTVPPLLAAVALGIACFVLGTGVYGGWAAGWVHGGLFYLSLVAEAWAAQREWRTFSAAERCVQRLEAAA